MTKAPLIDWAGLSPLVALIGGAIVLVAPPYRYLVPETVHAAILWGGASTAAAMLLWLGCVLVLCGGVDPSPTNTASYSRASSSSSASQSGSSA